jgi:RimJ/RimL family protein N-acetyltransferase
LIIAHTARLYLRPFHAVDVEALLGVFADHDLLQAVSEPHRPPWISQWFAERMAEYPRWGFGLWAVCLKARAERGADTGSAPAASLVGFCGLQLLEEEFVMPQADLSYRIAPAWRGRGLATEAAAAVRDYAFETLGLPRLLAIIKPANVAGMRVAEKIGMRAELETTFRGQDAKIYVLKRPPVS